ncbi:MAG: basic amino acid ABC transporter substrate-binding protein [Desulfitobacterium hafniense]|nr:basic amino acid ABC transporter substrate-binding protein [Desulfitobacterium hafniense]
MRKKVFTFATALVLITSIVLTGCGGTKTSAPANTASNAPAPAAEKVLKVGSDIAYAPFEFMDTKQQPTGFDIDLMTAIGEDLGYKVKFETAAFDGLIPALGSGKYDMVISAMTITEKRAQSVLFSDKYFEATQFIAVKKGSTIKSEADLKGKKVGVQVATTGQEVVEKLGITPKKYDTTPDALNDLINGGVEAVVADSPVVLWFIKQNPDKAIEAVKGNFEKEYYGIAFKKDDKATADKVNATLKKFMSNGKYNDIYKKWFNVDAPKF